jgi:glyceraldehyde-3-phosphate dehydrogenase type I
MRDDLASDSPSDPDMNHDRPERYCQSELWSFRVLGERDPVSLPWRDLEVDVVIESTGVFRTRDAAAAHLAAGARKVTFSAPAKDAVPTFVLGVIFDSYDPRRDDVISNPSCTTNCLAPVAKVLHDRVGISHGLMTSVHAHTADRRLVDLPHKDLRQARAASLNVIPTTRGYATRLVDLAERVLAPVPAGVGA